MNVTVNTDRMFQYASPASHIITDSAETMKLLEKKCGYVTPWSMETGPEEQEKNKQTAPQKELRKIDFVL